MIAMMIPHWVYSKKQNNNLQTLKCHLAIQHHSPTSPLLAPKV